MGVPIDKFVIVDDYREEHRDLGSLAFSIKKHGLIHPMAVVLYNDKYIIQAGRNRLRAMREYLEWDELEEGRHFTIRDDPDNNLMIQLIENFERKDFKPIELARLIRDIHEEKVKEHGRSVKGKGGGWSLENTASITGYDKSFISKMLSIANNEELVKDCINLTDALTKIDKAKTKSVSASISKAKTKKRRLIDNDINYYLDNFRNKSAEDYLPTISDRSIDLVLTDPPFGINYDEIASMESYAGKYEDDPNYVKKVMEFCVPEWYRVLKEDKYIICWSGTGYRQELVNRMKAVGFQIASTPLYWIKLNASGRSMNPSRWLGNLVLEGVYGWKGEPELTEHGRGNAFPHPIVRQDRIHPAQMPEQLVIDLLKVFSRPGDVVLDNFVGSGAVLRACFVTKRGFLGSEKVKETYHEAVSYSFDWAASLQVSGGNKDDEEG